MFYLYSINEREALVWAETVLEATDIYSDLFSGVIKTIMPVPPETVIYYIKDKITGDGDWSMEAPDSTDESKETKITTTIGALGESMTYE